MSELRRDLSVLIMPMDLDPRAVVDGVGDDPQVALTVLALTRASGDAWRRHRPDAAVLEHVLLRRPNMVDGFVDDRIYRNFMDALLRDPRTHLLVEREWAPGLVDESVFNLLPQLGNVARNALALFGRNRPDLIIARWTPHLVEPWVVCKLGEFLEVPVYFTAEAVLPGRAWMVSGIDQQEVVTPPRDREDECMVEAVTEFIDDRRATYGRGAPPRHKASLRSSRAGGWSLRVEAVEFRRRVRESPNLRRQLPRALYALRTSVTRRALWQSYRKLVTMPPSAVGVVTLFLHYQPERTTLPEAGRYGDQYELARVVSAALPNGWILQVREHPATFVGPGPFHPGFRSSRLYEAISSLPHTYLIELAADPFVVIDRSDVVVTATGTVGLESLCRGTPVIVAGRAQYRDAPGVLDISVGGLSSRNDVSGRIRAFCNSVKGRNHPSSAHLHQYLMEHMQLSLAPEGKTYSHSTEGRDHAHAMAIRDHLKSFAEYNCRKAE